jgi:hypothetical protein
MHTCLPFFCVTFIPFSRHMSHMREGNDVSPQLSVEKSRRTPIETLPEYAGTHVCLWLFAKNHVDV